MKIIKRIKSSLFNNEFFSNIYTKGYKVFDKCWMSYKYGDSYNVKQQRITAKKYGDSFFYEFERIGIDRGIDSALEGAYLRLERCVQGDLNDSIRKLIDKHAHLEFDSELYSKNEELIQKLNNMSYRELEKADWSYLERLFLNNAFFRAGLVCRNKAIECIANSNSSWGMGIEKFAALFEKECFDEARRELLAFKKRHFIQMLLKGHAYGEAKLYELMLNRTLYTEKDDINKAINTYKKGVKDDVITAKYRRMVEGRKILLKGPAPTPTETLDNALVAKINYFQSSVDDEKVDISYYNGDRSASLVNMSLDDISRVVRITKCRDRKFPVPNVRTMIWYNTLGINTAPLMVPLFLLDMMRFNTDRIKITGINLYMSAKRYTDSYENENGSSNEKFIALCGFAAHNGLSQFKFMKILYKHHFFDADQTLKSILSMSEFEYAKKMEDIFLCKWN